MEDAKKQKTEHESLSVKTARLAVIGGVLLVAVALGIGLILHLQSLIQQYTGHAFDVATYAHLDIIEQTDTAVLGEDVMAVYRSLSPEERSKTGTPEYAAHYADVGEKQKSSLDYLSEKLKVYIESGEVDDVYVAMFDEETSALVYVVDPQDAYHFSLGEWETVEISEARKFLHWDGEGILYDLSRTETYGWMCTAGVPVRNEAGEVTAFVLSDVTLVNIYPDLIDYLIKITFGMIAAITLIIILISYYIKKEMVEPINAIAGAAEAYAKSGPGENHDHFSSLNIHTGDEIENLSHVMADMEKELAQREDSIRSITAERERERTELRMAHDIQESMLPHVFPPFPEKSEFDIHASMVPAKEVGGDFYDFFLVDRDHLCLVIADVSGKGVPAALYMMVSKVILQNSTMMQQQPDEILKATNEMLCTDNSIGMFVTVWIGILEISTGIITASNAGHEYPAVFRRETGRFELLKDKHNMVVGGMGNSVYDKYEIKLNPGDKIFVYTDGIPEATRKDRTMFGIDRMIDALNVNPDASPEETLTHVREAVDAFVEDAEQFDDLTMMCMEYRPNEKDRS